MMDYRITGLQDYRMMLFWLEGDGDGVDKVGINLKGTTAISVV
jgi:hypothetical protein